MVFVTSELTRDQLAWNTVGSKLAGETAETVQARVAQRSYMWIVVGYYFVSPFSKLGHWVSVTNGSDCFDKIGRRD